jgi:hypothetical protein
MHCADSKEEGEEAYRSAALTGRSSSARLVRTEKRAVCWSVWVQTWHWRWVVGGEKAEGLVEWRANRKQGRAVTTLGNSRCYTATLRPPVSPATRRARGLGQNISRYSTLSCRSLPRLNIYPGALVVRSAPAITTPADPACPPTHPRHAFMPLYSTALHLRMFCQ